MTGLDDLRLLRTFVRIAESGSISAAARGMNMPQPTVSRQLRQLEGAVGVDLVRRDTHALSLTGAGNRLLEDARALLALAGEASERVREDTGSARGHLRIVSVLDSGIWMAPRLLAEFRKTHPQVTAELHLTNRPSKFTEEGFDCGILVGAITDRSVAIRKAGEIRRLLVASPELLKEKGAPRDLDDLQRLPWMGILQPHFFSRDRVELVKGREQRTVRFTAALLMDSVTALRQAAIAGAGVSMQPEWLVSEDLKKRRLVHVLPSWRPKPVETHIVFPTGKLPAAARAFIDYAAAELPHVIEEFARGA